MSFLNEDEQKEVSGNFFRWTDGKTYRLNIRKGWTTGFAKANGYNLICEDKDAGTSFEKKYEFNLLNAIQNLGDAYQEGMTVKVTPHFGGMKPNKDKTKEYEVWTFSVELEQGETVAPAEPEAQPFN